MATKLTAPRMGEGIEELVLVKWLKQPGDAVEMLQPIVEVETDKVATELPSPSSGVVLETYAREGETVKVGELLAWIGKTGETIPDDSSRKKTKKSPKAKTEKENQPQEKMENSFLSPLVRKMVKENNLDVDVITGSGKDGRITKKDVLAFMESENLRIDSSQKPELKQLSSRKEEASNLVPVSNIRRTIAERMIASQRTSAHVLTVMEADLSRVAAHRAINKPLFAEDGVRLTLTAYFMKAIVAGLKTNPKVNASWNDEGLLMHSEINIGMAVSLGKQGLIVPVIKRADTLSLLGTAQKVNDLAQRARSKQLKPEEVRRGTFSLTNHGLSGSLFATPIITQPQVGILGTGSVQKRAVVITDADGNDMIAIRPMIYLSFVFDHRVLDGEGADVFLSDVVKTLENWH